MSELEKIKPGEAITPEQRAALAKENVQISTEAERLAREHRERDQAEGRGQPPVHSIASMLKKKLENGEFSKKED